MSGGWAWVVGGEREGRRLWVRARRCASFLERARGLLGTGPRADPVLIERCGSVHTWGMRYAIDLALVSSAGRVMVARRGVGPGRVICARGARLAVERPAAPGRWFEVGDEVRVERIR